MSASWDSDLSSIIEKTNNNLKLLRKIGDKPQARAPDVSSTAPRAGSAAGSASSHASARPRAFVRADDDSSSMGSRGSARPRAFVRGDDDTNSMGSHSSARPRVYLGDDGAGSVSSHSSARPKAFIRADDDAGSVSSRASARPKAFIRADDDAGSVSSRASARPKAFVRGDDDTGSLSSNPGLGRARLDSGHGSVASSSGRPHVGIAGGGGLTAAMLQQHRASSGGAGALGMADLGAPRPRFDLDETRSMSGVSASRLSRRLGADGRVPHARPLGASMGPRIRVPDADIPSDVPKHVVEEIKKSLETHFASRNGAVDKKVVDLRTDVAGLTTQTSSLTAQMAELRDAVLVSTNSGAPSSAASVSDPKLIASVQANAAAIARLEEHSADLLGRKVSVDRELAELGSRVKALSSSTMKISTLEDNVEALVANRQKQEQGLFKLADRVQLMHRQMGSYVDMKAVENLLSIRLTREFREMEDRLAQNVMRMAEKMEQKVQSLEKQSFSQRQESLAALKSDLTDDIQRLQGSALRKSDLLPLQNAQTQSKEDLAQLSSALDRQEKKLQDAKLANTTLRDELADARTELNKALQSQQRSATAVMEEKLDQITSSNKEKSNKFDDKLSELAKKQKKLEEATKTLQDAMSQVKVDASQRLSRSSSDREEENDKLRQRLARSVAELEALATTKAEVERRFASEEQQFQARLKELRTTLAETEKQKETQRLELMQKLQEESKLMGVAQGKNSLLENLLAREKAENEEKNELVRKSKKEVAEVREQIHNLETEKEKKVRQLTSELQAKQTQVGLLTKTLKRIETASAKMLDLSKREAKTVRRVKATKEHELFIAQLKLKEMERVAQALQNGDEMKKQAALTAASTEERNELENLLLESQLEKDELKQELEEMTEEFNAAKESQKVIMEDTITKLSSDYDEKIGELKQQIADKEQAMRQLRDTLVEKSNLDALEDELASLKDEKNDLLEQIQRAQIEHERVTLNAETNLRLDHSTELSAMKSKFEERISELEGAKSELEKSKATITELEKELVDQESLHQREVSSLTLEIKDARSKIDECTAQILDLEETKARLEGEVSQMEANIGGASAEKEEELVAIKSQMQSEVDKLRVELNDISNTLEEKQTQLKGAKQSDEVNRQKLVEMAMAQEEMQSRYVSQIDSLTLKLNQERESSRAREQDLEDSIDKLNADVKALKAESNKELEAARSELTDQMTELTMTLKASQHREQQLQSRLKRILEELVQAANASGENDVVEDSDMSDDDAITHHLDALYATHRRTAHELERLQAEYELTVKQAAADSATAQELDNQVKEHETQIRELESVVEQLRGELKEQYHKSAIIAKGSDEFSEEMEALREEKRQLERQLQDEEKDRAKREVSYQRRTEMKEREVEELRTENKTLTAAVAAVREKIRGVENVKYHDLGELQSKLKDLEERTAALLPDESNVASLEKDFTTTRQEIVTLTAEVQSLYQKLTACCGIMEWSELRASVFDEEEKLTRVRAESARELAKVQSVEQEVLMNAEFLNALLVAHGSSSDDNLLNDFRWMQKYASIAPEIVEKLRKVESRLRDAVLDLNDGSSSVYPEGISKVPASNGSADEVVPQAPISQNSAVDGAAIALALEKAKENYFTETSEAAQENGLDEEGVKQDVDQPDVEQENPVGLEGEGASYEHVDEDGGDSIGETSHDESRTDAELVVAEHVLRDEQERSHEEQAGASLAMPNLDKDEDSSDDVAEDSFKSRQDRIDDDVDGLVPSADRKIEATKVQSRWRSLGFSGDGEDDDMDEVERLMLEQSLAHSSEKVKPHIDNECDSSDEFAHADLVNDETEGKQTGAVVDDDDVDEISSDDSEQKFDNGFPATTDVDTSLRTHEPTEQSDSELEASRDVSSEEGVGDQDPLEESSFDNAMMAALEGKGVGATYDAHEAPQLHNDEVDVENSDSDGYMVQDAIDESSFDDSVLSENEDERIGNLSNLAVSEKEISVEQGLTEEKPTPVQLESQLENSLNVDESCDSDASNNMAVIKTLKEHADDEHILEGSTASSVDLPDHLLESSPPDESASSLDEFASHTNEGILEASGEENAPAYRLDRRCEKPPSSLEGDVHLEDNVAEEAVATDEIVAVDDEDALEESLSSAENSGAGVHFDKYGNLEESSSSLDNKGVADQYEEVIPKKSLTCQYSERHIADDSHREEDTLEDSELRLSTGSDADDDRLDDDGMREENSSTARELDDGSALNESASSVTDNPESSQPSTNIIVEESPRIITREILEEQPESEMILPYQVDDEPHASTIGATLATQPSEYNHMLEESTSSTENSGAVLHQDEGASDDSTSSARNVLSTIGNTYEVDTLEDSGLDQSDEQTVLGTSLSRIASGTLAAQLDDTDSLEMLASRLNSNTGLTHRGDLANRNIYGGPLASPNEDNDDAHYRNQRVAVAVNHSDPLAESSYDEDALSNDEGPRADSDSEPTKPLHDDEDDGEWSEEQLRAAERSLHRPPSIDDDREASSGTVGTTLAMMSLRMEEDDDSSEEEETMTVPTQPTFSATLSRFGVGARRLNLEEDDDMDEVERLLLEQSASSMRKKQPQQLQRFTTSFTRDEDEFGATSHQSHDNGVDEFGEGTIRSLEDESGEALIQSNCNKISTIAPVTLGRQEEDDEFGEASIRSISREDNKFGETSVQSRRDDWEQAEANENKRYMKSVAPYYARTENKFEDTSNPSRQDEFGEITIQSTENLNFAIAPATLNRQDEEDTEVDEVSIGSIPCEDNEAPDASITNLSHMDDDFDEQSTPSHEEFNKAPDTASLYGRGIVTTSSIRATLHDSDEFGESSIEAQNDNAIQSHDSDTGTTLYEPRAQEEFTSDAAALRSKIPRNDGFGEVQSRGVNELGESPIQLRSDGEDDFAETSICSSSNEEDDDEFGEISIPLQDDTPVGTQAYSHPHGLSDSTHTSPFTDRAVTYHEGLMPSSAKVSTNLNTTATDASTNHAESTSDVENEYMDESFDLDESLEEEEDGDEQDV
ncbi:unnamed protein product [Phytophthora fragariaefolia]|uniref:Unnamed protein product n=1 Tax=Phytophthora fragariaefolia TaxID=1490495 RepID=A0A9W6XJA1_9STRA|nr:unnamed protein product [Phytophthora fragariaefolia]